MANQPERTGLSGCDLHRLGAGQADNRRLPKPARARAAKNDAETGGLAMHSEVERVYMELLVDIGRAGLKKKIYLVWSNQKKRFLTIREGDYREEMIDSNTYELVGSYTGVNGYPRYARIIGDIYAFIQEEIQKEYGCRPELERLAQTSRQGFVPVGGGQIRRHGQS